MVKGEITGKRDLSYSKWHRTIGNKYYMIDFDSVEWRNGRGIVALIECALNRTTSLQTLQNKKFEFKVYTEASREMRAPAYLVIHNFEMTWFEVYKIINEKAIPWRKMQRKEYEEFIKNL